MQKTEPKLKQWRHVVATYDAQEIRQCMDGKLDTSVKVPAKQIASQKVEFHIGKAQTIDYQE